MMMLEMLVRAAEAPCNELAFVRGVVWCGVVWCGVVWCGVVWCGVAWCGVVWCGVVWCGVWRGVVWCGLTWLRSRSSLYDFARVDRRGVA